MNCYRGYTTWDGSNSNLGNYLFDIFAYVSGDVITVSDFPISYTIFDEVGIDTLDQRESSFEDLFDMRDGMF